MCREENVDAKSKPKKISQEETKGDVGYQCLLFKKRSRPTQRVTGAFTTFDAIRSP